MRAGVVLVVLASGCIEQSKDPAIDAGAENVDGSVAPTVEDGGAALADDEVDAMLAALSELGTFVDGSQTLSRAERSKAIGDYLRTNSVFEAVTESDDAFSAAFHNGVPIVVFKSVPPSPDAGAAPLLPSPRLKSDTPGSARARLVFALGSAFPDATPDIERALANQGYSVQTSLGEIDDLRSISGDGVFYFNTHGGVVSVPKLDTRNALQTDIFDKLIGTEAYAFWTRTKETKESVQRLAGDLKLGRLAIMHALEAYDAKDGREVNAWHIGITDKFVSTYWHFAPNSLVWLSACSGASERASSIRNALFGAGAGAIAGWKRPTRSDALNSAATFAFDRLLGANSIPPFESPPQRAFDLVSVWQDMKQRGLTESFDSKYPSELMYFESPTSTFAMLAPSIAYVLVDEVNNEARLIGLFGAPRADQRVTIGGGEVTIHSWTEREIRVELPTRGAGSSGDVTVFVNHIASNTRRITEWHLNIQYSWTPPSFDPLKVDGPVLLRIRADVGDYRASPGQAPLKPTRYAIPDRDSVAVLAGSGSKVSGTCTLSYSGTGVLQASSYGPVSQGLSSWLRFDTGAKVLNVTMLAGGLPPFPWHYTRECSGTTLSYDLAVTFGLFDKTYIQYQSPLEDAGGPAMPGLTMSVGDDWGVRGGKFDDPDPQTGLHFTWIAAPAITDTAPREHAAR